MPAPLLAPTPVTPAGPKPLSRRSILGLSFAAFFVIGALQAVYGPSFPLLQERFGIGLDRVSMVVSAQFLGAFLGIIASGLLLRAIGYRGVLLLAVGAIAGGLVVVGLSTAWAGALGGAGLAGVGAGLLNVACNLMVAVAFRPNAAPALNLINALFGLGSVAAPLLVTLFEPRLAPPFYVLAGAALLLLPWILRTSAPAITVPSRTAAPVMWGSLAAFVLLYVFYVSVEAGVTAWETVYLTPHFGARAAAFTSAYWLAIAVGRLAAAPLSTRLRPPQMVLFAAAGAFVLMLTAHRVESAPLAFVLVGLALAPVFPTALAWLTEEFPQRTEQVTPVVVAAANLGPALSAPLIGMVVDAQGVRAVPSALSVAALALLVTVGWLYVRSRGRA